MGLLVVIFVLFIVKIARDSLSYVWLWQVKEYRIDRMISHLRENVFPLDKGGWGVIIAVVMFISYFIFLKNYPLMFQYLVLALFAYLFLQTIKEIKNRSLKRPKPTLKIIFIFSLLTIVYLLIAFCWVSSLATEEANLPIGRLASGAALMLFIYIANPLTISSIVLAIEPIFYFQKKRIVKRAAEKMRKLKKVKVIGITGSYGKTSAKEFLYAILSQKYKVVKTEGNNNTNIGVAYTVLNKVNDDFDYFICEMGAYKIGEIKEMCDMVSPEIGILTGINEQHIDLFGSFENIIKAKFELIKSLPENGLAVINEKLKAKSEKTQFKVKNVRFFYLSDVRNIKVFQDYAEFEYICHCEKHQRRSNPEIMREELNNGIAALFSVARNDSSNVAKFKFNILGKHYIENVLSAIMVAEYLGMSLNEIEKAIEKIKPNECMMRKFRGLDDSVFIDDSYSANPDGVMAALGYLEEAYKDYKKIIVFPGIIELGKESEEAHRKLYNRIGEVCDIAYIMSQKFVKSKVCKVNNRTECKFVFEKDFNKVANILKNNLDKNAVVLFESRGAGVVMGRLIKK